MPSVDCCVAGADVALWIEAADEAVNDAEFEFDGAAALEAEFVDPECEADEAEAEAVEASIDTEAEVCRLFENDEAVSLGAKSCEADESVYVMEALEASPKTGAEVCKLFESDEAVSVESEDAASVTEAAVDTSLDTEAEVTKLFDTDKALLLKAEAAAFEAVD